MMGAPIAIRWVNPGYALFVNAARTARKSYQLKGKSEDLDGDMVFNQ